MHIQSTTHLPAFDGVYEVVDRVFAGPTAVALNERTTGKRLVAWGKTGVSFILSVGNRGEYTAEADVVRRLDIERIISLRFVSVHGANSPTRRALREALNVLDEAVSRKFTAYVHCQTGRRASAVLAGWHCTV